LATAASDGAAAGLDRIEDEQELLALPDSLWNTMAIPHRTPDKGEVGDSIQAHSPFPLLRESNQLDLGSPEAENWL
jgi:hypothetical protein